jgi:hypothetical protein
VTAPIGDLVRTWRRRRRLSQLDLATTARPPSPGSSDPRAPTPPIVGFDVAVTGADGRISAVHGFLDRVPS